MRTLPKGPSPSPSRSIGGDPRRQRSCGIAHEPGRVCPTAGTCPTDF